jgi:phosphoserine phosphatase RsbU/P
VDSDANQTDRSYVAGGVALAAAVAWLLALLLGTTGVATPWLILGGFVVISVASVRLNGIIGEARARQRELQRELSAAQQVQRSLLPSVAPDLPYGEFAMACRMSRAVGGDCVDILVDQHERIVMLVGDVSGKGLAAALVMSSVVATFRTLATIGQPLPQIAAAIDGFLRDHRAGRYVTAVLIRIDRTNATLEYINAGHVPFFILHDGAVAAVESNSPPMGLLPGAAWSAAELGAEPSLTLVLVTDGITEREAPDREGVEYGLDRVTAMLRANIGARAQRIVDALLADSDAFAAGRPAGDDLTIVAIRLEGADAGPANSEVSPQMPALPR